jgi:hypothetical protein
MHRALTLFVAMSFACNEPSIAPDGATPMQDGSIPRRDARAPMFDSGPPREYPRGEPGCGLEEAAFCEVFDEPGNSGFEGRVVDLDGRRWSAARMQPGLNWGEEASAIRPGTLPACRGDLPARVFPGQDVLVCDGNDALESRHLMMVAAEQSYGQISLRARQPFDFRDRTGTIVFDASVYTPGLLIGWVSLAVTADPSPAPSFAVMQNFENGAVPRAGFEVHLFDACGSAGDRIGVHLVNVFENWEERFYQTGSFDRETGCVEARAGALNHFEVRVSRSRIEVWGSDFSEDGVHFGELRMLTAVDTELSFDRGYVHVSTHNHSSLKYSENASIDAWVARYDNIGFDGPVVNDTREYSIADALEAVTVIENDVPEDRINVGYQIADAADGPEQTFTFRSVDPSDIFSARVALNGHFNFGSDLPVEDYTVSYRVNGGAWREHRFVPGQLALFAGPPVFDEGGTNVRGDGTGIAGAMSLVLELDPESLVEGDNTLEITTTGVPQSYRPYVSNIDLVLGVR